MTGYPDGLWGKHFWHQFGSTADDGSDPVGGLILGSDGDLYGTTTGGGSTGNGRIYKVNPKSHELTIVYSFPRITYNGLAFYQMPIYFRLRAIFRLN